MHQKILILDFGSQYTQLIARRVREAGVYCELHPNDVTDAFVREFAPAGVILSGGPNSVYEEETPRAPQSVFELGVPVLGICYGMQTMAAQLGGQVESAAKREFGYAEIRARGHTALLRDIQDRVNDEGHGLLDVWMSHGDKVTALPPGFKAMASNAATPIAAMADEGRKFYGVQFHPEVTHTLQGKTILNRFVRDLCGCAGDWNMPDYVDEAIGRVRSEVGGDEVILGLSGGVDSSVVAALLHRAIGAQLTCVFVDNGLLRLNEAEQVMQTFAETSASRSSTSTRATASWTRSPACPTPNRSARSSAANSSTCSRKRPKNCPMPNGWRRAPSIPTSSNRPAPRPRRRTPSKATTTSAACPIRCT